MANAVRFLVIGAGIAGASAAYELAAHGSTAVVERESFPGYHTTGRSAAIYTETYGNTTIRALTTASRSFFEKPPANFSDYPLLKPLGLLIVGKKNDLPDLDRQAIEFKKLGSGLID